MIAQARLANIAEIVTALEHARVTRGYHGFAIGQRVHHKVTDETAVVVEAISPLESTRVPVIYDGDDTETVWHTLARKLEQI